MTNTTTVILNKGRINGLVIPDFLYYQLLFNTSHVKVQLCQRWWNNKFGWPI
ncbi:hypothetical protein CLOSBL3_30040 [Clostridiaceae bacterium BL-3]|nr:hypothetical protein CLOSBL3_30040 [Clostridiaceae bacterium BL-3]